VRAPKYIKRKKGNQCFVGYEFPLEPKLASEGSDGGGVKVGELMKG